MLISTPGLVLHVTPYGESSVVVKVFTRLLGLRSYIVKGVRGRGGRVKQNLLQPLSSLDMVVYDNPKTDLNYTKELSARHPAHEPSPVANAMHFFMTEVLYKTLREAEPMPALWDYADAVGAEREPSPHTPILFLLTVARHMGIEPMDNTSRHEPYFCLEEGRYVTAPNETTLSIVHSDMLHRYLARGDSPLPPFGLKDRTELLDALIAYFQLHMNGFSHFHSHEILHTILK